MVELFESRIQGKVTERSRAIDSAGVPKRVIDLHRNTQGLSQAIVKVSSYSKSQSRAEAHASYIMRHDKDVETVPVELSDGSVVIEHEDVCAVIDDWFAQEEIRSNARRVVNIVLSSPAGTDVEQLKASVRDFSSSYFQAHESMFVIHTDTPNPHAHLSVKTRSHHGEQLRLGRAELKEMKDAYAESLRDNGIEVHSSYRSDRGQFQRSVSQAVHHMREDDIKKNKKTRFDDKPLDDSHPAQDSLTRSIQRTHNEYLGAALFLRRTYGDTYKKEAQELEYFGDALLVSSKGIGSPVTVSKAGRRPQDRADDLDVDR